MASANKPYHHGNLRAQLIEAGRALLDEAGADGVTIRAVARTAGVSHAAPANHFRDRQALMTALVTTLFNELGEVIDRRLARAGGESAPGEFARALVLYGLKKPNRYKLLWRRDLTNNDDSDLQTAMDAIYDRLLAAIEPLAAQKVDKDTIAIALWSLAHGYVSLRMDGNFVARRDAKSGQRREDAIIELILGQFIET